ncbi:hypothetical protein [Phaeobacter sp. B1627]|uniref:hypothetical protein n=1 Tax=Phaeobacter sp. B1627 TaxID=2583809 RepID=UPI001117BF5E|nr:hypothetical protein [Phaeobacter sp. B1627]TNJ46708.1 hypothetical protein FGE21_04590 [Phaeobacter sp. B1627]
MTALDQNVANYSPVAAFGRVSGFPAGAPVQVSVRPGESFSSMLLRLLGGCMVLSSTGIWLVPNAGEDPSLALIRIGISVVLLFLGLCLMLSRERTILPEFQFDSRNLEMRAEETDADGRVVVLLRRSYASMGAVRFTDRSVQILEHDGTLLIEVPLDGRSTRQLLLAQLKPHLHVVT